MSLLILLMHWAWMGVKSIFFLPVKYRVDPALEVPTPFFELGACVFNIRNPELMALIKHIFKRMLWLLKIHFGLIEVNKLIYSGSFIKVCLLACLDFRIIVTEHKVVHDSESSLFSIVRSI